MVSENEVHLYPQNAQILQSMLHCHMLNFACLELHNCAHFLDKMQSPENRIYFINEIYVTKYTQRWAKFLCRLIFFFGTSVL